MYCVIKPSPLSDESGHSLALRFYVIKQISTCFGFFVFCIWNPSDLMAKKSTRLPHMCHKNVQNYDLLFVAGLRHVCCT